MRNFIISTLVIGNLMAFCTSGFGSQTTEEADRLVRVGDIEMSYRIYGEGQPLVMIMGYGSTMKLWEPELIRRLSSGFKVIVFDNRGMGNTGVGERPFTLEQFADDTAGLMEALGLPSAHLLGWSMGALIAEEVALRHPGKVNKLVLYAGYCDARLFPATAEVVGKLTDRSGTPQEQGMRFISLLFPEDWLQGHPARIREVFFRPMGKIPPETLIKQSQAIDLWKGCCDRLNQILNPTLVISGTEDVIVPPQNATYLAGKIPKAQLELIENGGHGLMFQVPDKFNEKVVVFLRR